MHNFLRRRKKKYIYFATREYITEDTKKSYQHYKLHFHGKKKELNIVS